jgi:hypothetical protein
MLAMRQSRPDPAAIESWQDPDALPFL